MIKRVIIKRVAEVPESLCIVYKGGTGGKPEQAPLSQFYFKHVREPFRRSRQIQTLS